MEDRHLVRQYNMQPHQEGGFWATAYRTEGYSSIYYLLAGSDYSAFHRLSFDEIWYLHQGRGLYIHQIDSCGTYHKIELSFTEGVQLLIPAGTWFAAEPIDSDSSVFLSCMCQPAFTYDGFELGLRDQLLHAYPDYATLIERFCRV